MEKLRDKVCSVCVTWLDYYGVRPGEGRAMSRDFGMCPFCAGILEREIRRTVAELVNPSRSQPRFYSTKALQAHVYDEIGHEPHATDVAQALHPARPRSHRMDGGIKRGYSVTTLQMTLDNHFAPADIGL